MGVGEIPFDDLFESLWSVRIEYKFSSEFYNMKVEVSYNQHIYGGNECWCSEFHFSQIINTKVSMLCVLALQICLKKSKANYIMN